MTVPRGDGEHAVRPFERSLDAPSIDRLHERLGVAVAPEGDPRRLEFRSHQPVVVDLPVEHQRPAARSADHRLAARRAEVDDRESPLREHRPS